MRVAVVVGSFPELSTTFILDQIVGLLELGHDVQVFAHRPRGQGPVHPQVEAYGLLERTHHWFGGWRSAPEVVARSGRLLAQQPRVALEAFVRSLHPRYGYRGMGGYLWSLASSALLELPFDVVLCHFGENAIKADQLRRIGALRAPLATVFHGYDLSRFVKQRGEGAYAALFREGELMLPISAHWRDRLLQLGCPAHKVVVHHMGIDCGRIAFRARTRAPGEPTRLVSVCRLVEKKGVDYALQALARVRDAGVRFEYHVVGNGPDRAQLERLTASLGLQACVVFHGAKTRDEVLSILDTAHVFLAPSVTARDGDQEGIPVSIMEAMAAGLPVVSTVHTGIPELVRDGETGYLAPERDVPALAACLLRLLAAPDTWARLGRQGRARVEAEYDSTQLNKQLAALLEALVASASSARAS